ncbi:MAG: HAMP domain-containing protein [Isosphaeraceae bacterium]|nr:HAMP domain-containing protein [Isosphaeraceae bacterium]
MRWSFRTKLTLALLLFGLVPTLLMTFVTFEATEQVKDRAARVVYRNALAGARAIDHSPLDAPEDAQPPILDREDIRGVIELFDQLISEAQIPTLRLVFLDSGRKVVATWARRDEHPTIREGERLPSPYAELIRTLAERFRSRRPDEAPYLMVDDGLSGPEILSYATVQVRDGEKAPPSTFGVLAIAPQGDVFRPIVVIRYKILGLFTACFLATALAGVWLGGRFVRPLTEVMGVARHLEQGHLDTRARITTRDELGRLARQVNSVIDRLNEVIREIGQATTSVSTASNELSASAQELSQGATEQASTLQEIASSLQTVDASVKSNAEHAKQTAKAASDARHQAEEGGRAVQETVATMRQIAQRIQVVEDIAYQTNLLALNAAIEAARAGAQGKGFAVVAGEVRKLAERSQEAARQIGELAGSSVQVAENAGALLEKIVPMIRTNSTLVQEIAAASQEQTAAIHQINVGVRQLDEVVRQNVASSIDLASTASGLASQAASLEHLVGFFRLGASPTAAATPGTPTPASAARSLPTPAASRPSVAGRSSTGHLASEAPAATRSRPASSPELPSSDSRDRRTPGGIVVNLDDDADFERF